MLKPCSKRSRGCLPKEPWKLPEILVPAFTVAFSWWRRRLAARNRSLSPERVRPPYRFKMETVASLLLSVRKGDFLASLDLKDAYFQIPIHRSSRKLLSCNLTLPEYLISTLLNPRRTPRHTYIQRKRKKTPQQPFQSSPVVS